jgi:hypothetical protein
MSSVLQREKLFTAVFLGVYLFLLFSDIRMHKI